MSDAQQFSSADLLPFNRDTTIRWSCRADDIICWLRLPGAFSDKWNIQDYWQCYDGDCTTITNRPQDFPSWFKLHPLETRGAAARKSISFEEAESIERVDAPNIWRVQAGDRIFWTGGHRQVPAPVEGVLGMIEFREDALVVRENSRDFDDMESYILWQAGQHDAETPAALVALIRNGLKIVRRLGSPRSYSTGNWGIG